MKMVSKLVYFAQSASGTEMSVGVSSGPNTFSFNKKSEVKFNKLSMILGRFAKVMHFVKTFYHIFGKTKKDEYFLVTFCNTILLKLNRA